MPSNPSMSSVKFPDIFEAALEEYAGKTNKNIKTDPLFAKFQDCNSSDAVLKVLEEQALSFEQYRKGDWKVQLMRRLKPTVDVLLRLSTNDFLQEGVVSIFPPAKAIFTSIGHLLEAAKGVSSDYDALIELFEWFERYFRRLSVLTEIPSAVGEISVKIMVELLGMLALAMLQLKQGRLRKFGKKLLGESGIEAVLQRLDRLSTEESRVTSTQTMEVVCGLFNNMKVVMDNGEASIDHLRDVLVKMQTILDESNKTKRDQLREKIQKWLCPPDPSINHNTACKAHKDGTAAWFLDGSVYDKWKTTGSLLWIHGNPGSGKSVLCSSIITDIESACATGLASAAYYYFDYKDPGKQGRRGLLSSLLTQLCARSHLGYDILLGFYEDHQDGLRQPKEVELIRCLKRVLELPRHGRVYIIVDALDESPNKLGIPTPREDVLRLIKELDNLRHPDIRICITSRPEVDIQMELEPLASHAVSLHDQAGQRSDIVDYIKSVVETDRYLQRRWREQDRQMMIDSLSQNAKGMFRWVVCQLDALRRSFPTNIQRILKELPMTLDETYERILLEIDKEKREHAIRIFQCLAFSHRPLRAKELAEVLAIQFDTTIPTLNTSLRPKDAHEAVLSACSSLVTTVKLDDHHDDDDRGDTQILQFSHYSVKEFLTSERLINSKNETLSQYYISPKPAHATLAQSCISTLLQLENYAEDIVHGFPLAKYAAGNWFHHAQCHDVAPCLRLGMESLFDPTRKHFAVWVSIHDIGHVSSGSRLTKPSNLPILSPLYYAVLCGIDSLVEYLINTRRQDPNKSRGSRGTPLHAAVVFGHIAIAQILLDHNADVNSQDEHDSTPLHEASGSGNFDAVQLLLHRGANVNVLDHQGDSPLHKTFEHQKFDAMELLIKRGANINVLYKSKSTLLHETSKHGYLDIMQLLLNHDADLNILDHEGVTPLQEAFRHQRFDAVNLLVRGGADVNVRYKFNSTPLHDASRFGNVDITRLLLSHDADVNALDHKEVTPLQEALQHRSFDVVKLLVEAGADVNVRNKSNSTPLHEASGVGNIDITRLLLDLGADVNVLDDWGDSPLHKASRIRKFDVAELLVKGGADMNVRNKFNSTVLHEASGDGDLDVIRWLISHNAGVNTLDNRGDSPLHKASRFRKFEVAVLLVKGGADVNIRNKSDSTPLHEASVNGDLDIVQLLLSHGANVNAVDHRESSPIFKALRSQKIDVLEFLVKEGADVNARDKCNSTLLHKASGIGNPYITLSLLSQGAVVNTFDDQGDSALHKAIRFQKPDVAKLLVDHGADVNVRNIFNSTPLHEASGNGDLDITRLLLNHGADVNVFDDRGDSPLHKALRFQKSDVAELLIKAGADVNVRDKFNSNPPHEASGIGNLATTKHRLGNAQESNHKTSLHSASLKGELRSFTEHEADVDDENDAALTAALPAQGKLLNNSVLSENMPEGARYIWIMTAAAVATGGDNGGETLPLNASEGF